MHRDSFRFQFPAADLAAAAKRKAEYHRSHEQDYRSQHTEALTVLKASGVEVRTHPVTGGVQATAVVDPEKLNHVNNTLNKAEQHRKDAEGYEMWARSFDLSANGQTFHLDSEDVLYFGL